MHAKFFEDIDFLLCLNRNFKLSEYDLKVWSTHITLVNCLQPTKTEQKINMYIKYQNIGIHNSMVYNKVLV